MQFSMLATQAVQAIANSALNASGGPSPATISGQSYSSSDSTVFTVVPDPSTPGGAILTGVAIGTATLTVNATATEPDGVTTEQIQGVVTIVLTSVAPPPLPAASLVVTFGTPYTPAPSGN